MREHLTKTHLKASHAQAVSTYNVNPVNVSFHKHPSKDELQTLFNKLFQNISTMTGLSNLRSENSSSACRFMSNIIILWPLLLFYIHPF